MTPNRNEARDKVDETVLSAHGAHITANPYLFTPGGSKASQITLQGYSDPL
jgi:hypothetical protein